MEKQNSCVILGDIITYDILTRVPTESLVRFRCVRRKTWSKLLLDDPLFIKLHSQRYDNLSYSSGFIDTERHCDPISRDFIHSLVFINHNDKKKRIIIPICIPYSPIDNLLGYSAVSIMHSLNGLLVLRCHHDYSYKYYVYNPITRCSIIIPIPINDVEPGKEFFCRFRLCYDTSIEKHKVVFSGPFKRKESSPYPLKRIKILTVGDGLGGKDDPWRDIVIPDGFHWNHDSLVCVDMLYTVCQDNYLYRMIKPRGELMVVSEWYIFRLDAGRELYDKIKLPDEVSALNLECVVNEMGGLLCLSHYNVKIHELRMWTLKNKDNDRDENEWVEIRFNINISTKDATPNYASVQPLAILKSAKMKLIVVHYSDIRYDELRQNSIHNCTYYSYDTEIKQLELIHGPTSSHLPSHWHVNSFANC